MFQTWLSISLKLGETIWGMSSIILSAITSNVIGASLTGSICIEIYLVSDEPYRKIIFDDKKYPFIFNYHDRSIVVTSHSKDLGLAGERIGYIIVSPKDKDREVLFDAIIFCSLVNKKFLDDKATPLLSLIVLHATTLVCILFFLIKSLN